ncbi:MAG: hydrogen gas-evolving membrane-bound hydrogenase subunit E [Coriobacteriia bacterium]|nr:hydrogen gas-evolving membrane-bound hydrogenase subunit E [Coriobacteriia bacterium]
MKKAFVAALLIITAIPLLIGMAAMPRHGNSSTPVHTHVSARYLERGSDEAGSDNIVTGVLLNYRGLDTAGEVTVIFTALLAVLAVLIVRVKRPPDDTVTKHVSPRLPTPVSPIVDFVVRLMAPFIALFGIYVVAHGHVSPGGGFQGGAILGGLFIVLSVVLGRARVMRMIPRSLVSWLQGAGVLSFVLIGIAGAVFTGSFLGFPAEQGQHLMREVMMLALEAGIGVGGAAIFASIFLQMEAE